METMPQPMAQQIARAAIAFEKRRTGHVPRSVTVVLSEGTLVITLHDALSPAERGLAQTPEGVARMQDFHRQLFASSSEPFLADIKKITGMAVREVAAELVPASGAVIHAFTTGSVVQVHQLDGNMSTESWSNLAEASRS